MKNFLVGLGLFVLWGLFLFLPVLLAEWNPDFLVKVNGDKFDELSMAYTVATAFFTALAFGVTWLTLRKQRQNLKQQRDDLLRTTTLDVFTNVFNDIQTEVKFLESKNYIFSNHFENGLQYLTRKKGVGNVVIDDFKTLTNKSTSYRVSSTGSRMGKYNDLISYFCNKMEYIGIIVKHKYIDETILDYFGETIILSYNRLRPILEAERLKNSKSAFVHYYYLFKEAEKWKNDFIEESEHYYNHLKWPEKGRSNRQNDI